MKIAIAILIFTALIVTTSCKKDVYGCTNINAVNYSAVATKDDGSCHFQPPAAESTVITISNWTNNGNGGLTSILPWGEITTDVIQNGAVMTYLETGTNVWSQLPLTVYNSGSYSTTYQVSITVGQVIVLVKNSDLVLPADPGALVFKITIVS